MEFTQECRPSDEVEHYQDNFDFLIEHDWHSIANFLFLQAYESKTLEAEKLARNAAAYAEARAAVLQDSAVLEETYLLPTVEHPLGAKEAVSEREGYSKHPRAGRILEQYMGQYTIGWVMKDGNSKSIMFKRDAAAEFQNRQDNTEWADVPSDALDKLAEGAIDPELN